MTRIIAAVSTALLVLATCTLMVLAAVLIAYACWGVFKAIWTFDEPTHAAVGAVSLIIIAFAVIALSQFIVEEEIERKRELASPREARRSLTKFVTIMVIAFSLEALVMIFEASRGDAATAIYPPIALFGVVVLALVGLGAYQWLSNEVEPGSHDEAAREKQRRKA